MLSYSRGISNGNVQLELSLVNLRKRCKTLKITRTYPTSLLAPTEGVKIHNQTSIYAHTFVKLVIPLCRSLYSCQNS